MYFYDFCTTKAAFKIKMLNTASCCSMIRLLMPGVLRVQLWFVELSKLSIAKSDVLCLNCQVILWLTFLAGFQHPSPPIEMPPISSDDFFFKFGADFGWIEQLQKQDKAFLYALHPTSLNGSTLHNCRTMSTRNERREKAAN